MSTTPDHPTYERIIITPALATEWLKRNTNNRRIDDKVVAAYSRDMAAGNWRENGDAIRFDWNGVLLDGQHKLTSIARSGVSLAMMVVTDLDPATQHTMDDGRKRTAGDMWTLNGYPNATTLAATVSRAWRWDQGDRRLGGTFSPTKTEQQSYVELNPQILRSVERGVQVGDQFRPLPKTLAAFAHFLCSRVDRDAAVWWFEKFATGADLKAGNPIKAARSKLINDVASGVKTSAAQKLTYVVAAWNADQEGRDLHRVIYSPGQNIPMPIAKNDK